MKRAFLLLVLLSFFMGAKANPVDNGRARQMAAYFLNVASDRSSELRDISAEAGFTNVYVFTTESSFVLMAADDCVQPILGYSLNGPFDIENMPDNKRTWIEGYSNEIQYAIAHQTRATLEVTQQWRDLAEGNFNQGRAVVVTPLLQTKWNQGSPYNLLCPGGSVTGCVATAMAQIMKYWGYPAHGIGSHSYTHATYGELSADFQSTTYDWSYMTNTYGNTSTTTQKQAVATLMYHCGVSVDMNYSPSSSGASTANVADALKTYFGYSEDVQHLSRSAYSDAEWIALLKNDLNQNFPVQYHGTGSGGGHSFVCDGYNEDNYFHFNWGWGGYCDEYYLVDNLNPGPGGIGSGTNGIYNDGQGAVFGIHPSECTANAPSNLAYSQNGSNVTLSWSSVSGASSYNVYCNNTFIGNTSSTSYSDTASYGSSVYYVRSVDSQGRLSLSSNVVTITVEYPTPVVEDLTATVSDNNVNLTWTAPDWCYPSTPTATMTYGEGNHAGAVGYIGSNNMYWGHRYLASTLSNYDNMKVYKVSFYANETGNYEVYVYQGTTSNHPQTQLLQQSFSVGITGWCDVDLSTPIQLDAFQDLWVFIYDPEYRDYPASYCDYTGTEGNYYSTNPASWINHLDNTAFLIRTFVSDGTYTYNLYRNESQIANNLSDTSYCDTNLASGSYTYYVKTNYYAGESNASNQVIANVGTVNYTIAAYANPSSGGSINGCGTYAYGQNCTLTAVANSSYSFSNWEENGVEVSSNASYSFTVTSGRNLVANFTNSENITFVDANVKALCVANWDTNGDGELSYAEAAAVTDLGTVFKNNTTITSFDELQYFIGLTSINNYAFYSCTGLTSIELSNSVTSIGKEAFRGCSGLTSIEIPNSVTSIGDYAFAYCSHLNSLTVLAETPPTLGNDAFTNVNKTIPVYVPCGAVAAYQTTSGWSEFTNFVGMGETVQAEYETTICVNDLPYVFHGVMFTGSGTEVITVQNPTGCDSILYLTVNVEVSLWGNYETFICDSQLPYVFHGEVFNEAGTVQVTHSGVTAQGCDSILTLTVNVYPSYWMEEYMTLCESQLPFEWNGWTITESGTYQTTFWSAMTGCDSIVTLNLTVIPSYEVQDYFTMCQGDIYTWQGHTFGWEAGVFVFSETLVSSWDCDSIVDMTVMVDPSYEVSDTYTLCQGVDFTWQGHSFGWEAGFFSVMDTLQTVFGCDSIVTLYLTINETMTYEWSAVSCNEFTWNDSVYVASGDYVQTFTSATGCDSIVTLHLTIIPGTHNTYYIEECGSYTWHGQTYTSSGTYIYYYNDEYGCLSEDILYLTIDEGTHNTYYIEECGSYTWHGQTYTSSGTYFYYYNDIDGCPSVDTLHLTVHTGTHNAETITVSDSYSWHGVTYTTSGTYIYSYIDIEGCPSVDTLYLTVEVGPITNHWTPVDDWMYPYSMTLYGIIQIDGVEQYSNQLEVGIFCGNECRGSSIASEFFLTHRYLVEANVFGDSGEQLTFRLYDHGLQQELDLTPPAAVTFSIDGYGTPVNPYALNFISTKDITATVDPEGAGVVEGAGTYNIGSTCTLTASANPGFQFQNWTLYGTVISTAPTYTFTVTGAATYVAHFQHVHSRPLTAGWNWWSTYIEQEGTDGLGMLENSMGTSGIRIQGKNSSVDYFEYQGTGYWYGALNAIANEQMYMIRTSAACNAVLVGDAATPENHPVTINEGWNWIGYPHSESISVDVAMSGFTPENSDIIKGRNNYATYYSDGNYNVWYGTLNTFEPGQGYMYQSNSDTPKILTFQTGREGVPMVSNVTPEGNMYEPSDAGYAHNMLITAVIDVDGEELRSSDYELAAFAGDECRGSVKLMYVEPIDRYVAFLLVFGDREEEIRFILTDGWSMSWSDDHVVYAVDGMEGSLTEPTVLHFGTMGLEDNVKPVVVYPNPSTGMFNIEGEGIQKVEIIDVYGQVVLSKVVKNDFIQVNLDDKADGAYLLRVVTDSGVASYRLIKNR